MRTWLIWIGAVFALGLLSYAVWQKESTLAKGETVYLKLAPLDPRSLMQGDYMVLRYELGREIRGRAPDVAGGRAIIRIDEDRVAGFERLDDGSTLGPDERYLLFKNRRGPKFGIESFFFQEGRAKEFENAEYAEIRLSPNGGAMLVDLVERPPQSPR
jgi:uncharacterized membrane-anchored protein